MHAVINMANDLLTRDLAPRSFVLEVVRWLDLSMGSEPDGVELERELYVRAFVATASLLPWVPTQPAASVERRLRRRSRRRGRFSQPRRTLRRG
jgi:hypothetical protein